MTRLAHADDMMATPREQRRGMQLEIAAGLARLLSAQSSSENASSAGTALGVPCAFHLACCKLHPIWHAIAVRHETREGARRPWFAGPSRNNRLVTTHLYLTDRSAYESTFVTTHLYLTDRSAYESTFVYRFIP